MNHFIKSQHICHLTQPVEYRCHICSVGDCLSQGSCVLIHKMDLYGSAGICLQVCAGVNRWMFPLRAVFFSSFAMVNMVVSG